jgi:hypothetical protein
MDIALKKLDLMHRLMLIWDEAALQRVAKAIETEVPEVEEDFTDEEIRELEQQRVDHLSGKTGSHSAEESIRMIRDGFKG